MKRFCFLILCLFALGTGLSALVYHSTTEGGWFNDPATWQSTTYPGPDDDVYIYGIVYVAGESNCHNLTVVGSDAVLRAGNAGHGTINVYGNLATTGWVSNSASYYLTVNLYGNLSIGYHFVPQTFNWLGSGTRTLSCPQPWGLKTQGTTSLPPPSISSKPPATSTSLPVPHPPTTSPETGIRWRSACSMIPGAPPTTWFPAVAGWTI